MERVHCLSICRLWWRCKDYDEEEMVVTLQKYTSYLFIYIANQSLYYQNDNSMISTSSSQKRHSHTSPHPNHTNNTITSFTPQFPFQYNHSLLLGRVNLNNLSSQNQESIPYMIDIVVFCKQSHPIHSSIREWTHHTLFTILIHFNTSISNDDNQSNGIHTSKKITIIARISKMKSSQLQQH